VLACGKSRSRARWRHALLAKRKRAASLRRAGARQDHGTSDRSSAPTTRGQPRARARTRPGRGVLWQTLHVSHKRRRPPLPRHTAPVVPGSWRDPGPAGVARGGKADRPNGPTQKTGVQPTRRRTAVAAQQRVDARRREVCRGELRSASGGTPRTASQSATARRVTLLPPLGPGPPILAGSCSAVGPVPKGTADDRRDQGFDSGTCVGTLTWRLPPETPIPNWPPSARPQHDTPPSIRTAQL